jgi:hypothetical protein
MTFKATNFQIKIDDGKEFSPVGGTLLISAFFDKFGLREVIDENIGASPSTLCHLNLYKYVKICQNEVILKNEVTAYEREAHQNRTMRDSTERTGKIH